MTPPSASFARRTTARVSSAEIERLRREVARLEKQSAKHAAARAALPAGSSRARVTTANARWGRSAEARDCVRAQLEAAIAAAGAP
jgi:hypothetical protein